MRCGSTCSHLIVADAAPVRNDAEPAGAREPATADAKARRALVVADATDSDLARELGARLGEGETSTSTVVTLSDYPDVAHDVVVMIPGPTGTGDPVAALTRRCLEMRDCAAKVDGSSAQLWLVFSGALQVGSAQVDPMETGAWAFSRTLANEHPKVDVRRIDVAPHVSPSQAGEHISRVIASGTRETELHLDGEAVRAVRVRGLERALEPTSSSRQNAARLERRAATGERLVWQPVRRRRPKSTEIEVEVEAVGLNFRDLMWSMSLLPEDMLEDGFSGAALGLECAGRVARIGSDVTDVEVGDKVMAFAGSSFATHVTIDAGQAVRLPEGVSCEGAATIPVAFFTAYWSLVTQAKLARREWVLIHGGAGGVGMAAVQIAQSRGARVIATAGSPAKRELLRALGVVHVLDSRSTDFVEQVRDITGGGVDVVLNSLAGEAMERSIDCLRPFGRFVELGKRDYAVNTHIGLRPFRRNLSYFGVDVDQVIGVRKAQADRVFARIVKGFETGKFVPLPHSVFDADSVATAFHLMQLSGHVGKIVVRPPTRSMAAPARKPLKVSSRGTHLVTGAFGGFGLETAKWLVDQGARHLVLVGRRGPSTPEAEAALQDFTDRGVKVMAEPCDVTDRHALEALLEAVHATMPPIVGVMHEAMVLDDGILANLDEERFHRVLGPKVIGAENLDRLVRGEKLDYFVLFSSVTTLVGNPGQGNYVAANAYMEGLARRRRRKGLPAVAIGWGPISDVGVVAQSERLQSGLEKLTGVTGMRAREALALMAKALEESTAVPETAVITITPSDGSYAADRLAVLRSPTYEAFVSAGGRRGEGGGETIDIKALAAEIGVEAARQRVVDVISAELAQVLHLREEEVSQTRPLGEIGLDSLMGLELLMQLEECFGIRAPLSGSSGAMTVTDIADEIMAFVGLGRDRDAAMAATLAVQHHGEVEPGQLEALKDFVSEEAHKTKTKRLLA